MKQSAFFALAVLVSSSAYAQQQNNVRVRGKIVSLEGDVLTVKSKNGEEKKLELAKDAKIYVAKKTTLKDIKPGTFVGSAAVKGPDGKLVAREVHTLPPEAPAGHTPWDLEPGSTMTNANLTGVAKASGGDEITLEYKDGEQKILVPKGVPVLAFDPGDRSALKKGETLFTTAQKEGDKLIAKRVQVSKGKARPSQ